MDARQSNMSLSVPLQSIPLNIVDLIDDAFEEILSYLSFDDIAKIRLVKHNKSLICNIYSI